MALVIIIGIIIATQFSRHSTSGLGEDAGKESTNPKDKAIMVWVPAGEFLMGSDDFTYEQPPHTVYIDSYWIYKTPVTVAQYRAFCQGTGCDMPSAPSWGWLDNHPMVKVNWDDAQAYATWAGASLPTEAQWEKAARGTDGRVYPWGNEWDAGKVQCSVKEEGDAKQTAPVGSYLAGVSPYGCLDMSGNVWQWCSDWYNEDYYRRATMRNPTGPTTGTEHVLRGGSWFHLDPGYFRAACRSRDDPTFRCSYFGFRCIVRLPGH